MFVFLAELSDLAGENSTGNVYSGGGANRGMMIAEGTRIFPLAVGFEGIQPPSRSSDQRLKGEITLIAPRCIPPLS